MTLSVETTASDEKIASALYRAVLSIGDIDPDPRNRQVQDNEEFQSLADSIRVFGVLQPIHVRVLTNGRHELVDGERRWRAAQRAGLTEIVCDVWPASVNRTETVIAGLVMNEHRRAPGCIQVARRLRDTKNELAFKHEQLASHTGLPLDRVKTYFSLFGASDFLINYFEHNDVPLKVAVEFVRFERATNEGHARRLLAQHLASPLTGQEIYALRKRSESKKAAKRDEQDEKTVSVALPPSQRIFSRFEAFLARDMKAALAELEQVLARVGYRLMPVARKE